mgnify:CR=1 FL=1
MKKFIPLLLAVFAVTLASCEKDPDMDKLDNNYLVYTNYDKKADFKTFETYYLPDSILSSVIRKTPNTGKMRMPRKFSALMLLT